MKLPTFWNSFRFKSTPLMPYNVVSRGSSLGFGAKQKRQRQNKQRLDYPAQTLIDSLQTWMKLAFSLSHTPKGWMTSKNIFRSPQSYFELKQSSKLHVENMIIGLYIEKQPHHHYRVCKERTFWKTKQLIKALRNTTCTKCAKSQSNRVHYINAAV